MAAVQNTFKRYEKKYMLNEDQYREVKKALKDYMEKDEHGSYSICNLYFDTDSYEIIRRSIEKPVYKEKLRVRSYGVPKDDDKIFFELKKKYRKEVFKRRISLTLKEYKDYIDKGIRPEKSEQILTEIEYFIKMYKPYPRVFIAYDREAFAGREDKNLRITFDHNIRFRKEDLDLSSGDHGENILDEGTYLMEIKIPGAMPLWLSKILNDMGIFSSSFSKYGHCYKNQMHSALA